MLFKVNPLKEISGKWIYLPFTRPKKRPATTRRRVLNIFKIRGYETRLLLPSALLMAVGLQALFALVLVHLEAAFLFEVTHVESGLSESDERFV